MTSLPELVKRLHRHFVLSWRAIATGERRMAMVLLSRGFLFQREPAFLTGRKPDFLTWGRGRIWVEVKELDPPVSQSVLGAGWDELSKRFSHFAGQCSIDALIGPGFDSRVAKQATRLVTQALVSDLIREHDLYIEIPAGETTTTVVRIDWRRRDGQRVRLVALQNSDGTYGCPPAAMPADWAADLEFTDPSGTVRIPVHEVLDEDNPARLLLRVDFPSGERPLRGVGNAEAHNVTTVDRLRGRVNDANGQLKNGQRHRPLPGLLVVYFDHLGGGDAGDVLRACLGDLTYAIDVDSMKLSNARYGANGAFRQDRNTSVSAIEYRSRHHPTVCLINPHAVHRIERSWLTGLVYIVDAAGNVQPG